MGVWKLRAAPGGADDKAALQANCLDVTELIPVINLFVIHPISSSYSINLLYLILSSELTIVVPEVRIFEIKIINK